jgi:lysophospholipase L1-like esterase
MMAKSLLLSVSFLFCIASLLSSACHTAAQDDPLARSLVSLGDLARLQRVMIRARTARRVVIAVIGGSITAGAAATSEEKRWGNRVAKWWERAFPETEIHFVNAGIGATGSNIGAHRAEQDLLRYQPDFVVAEFGVNDPNTEFAAETLEGLTRQILKQPNSPAMMLLFTMHRGGGNAQEWHSKIGLHYGLPMVSFRDALWPEIEAGRLKWEDVEADDVHPNDRGHEYCARFIANVLDRVLADLPDDRHLPPVPAVPDPLISDVFEYATMANADAIAPTSNTGWHPAEVWPFGRCWEAVEPGSALEFEVEGTAVSVAHYRIKGDMGMARAWVDDRPPVELQGWFEADWGGYAAWALVARDLAPGKHELRVELLDRRAEQSGGHKFQLQAIMTAGRYP